jgi:hypothetical protein
MVIAMKNEKEYLIGASILVEIDCLSILGMINNCFTPDIDVKMDSLYNVIKS